MKVIYLVLVCIVLLLACSPNTEATSPGIDSSQLEAIPGDSVFESKPQLDSPVSMKVLWVNKSIAVSLARELNCPIVMFVYSNKYQPSVDMDLQTFAHPDVAFFINANFVAMRAEYEDMGGSFVPSTMLILNQDGEILLTTIGYIDPAGMMMILEQAKVLDSMLKQNDAKPENKKEEADSIGTRRTWTKL